MSITNYLATRQLNDITGVGTGFTALSEFFVGVSSSFPARNGTNVTEPSTGSYARVGSSGKMPAATSTASLAGTTGNTSEFAFAQSTDAWLAGADLIALTVWDAASSGNLLRYAWMGQETEQYFPPAAINASTNRITLNSHGYTSTNSVVIVPVGGSTLPSGITANTRYYASAIDANTLELHTNVGLTAIVDIANSGTGSFAIFRITPRQVAAAGVTLRFPIGNLALTLN